MVHGDLYGIIAGGIGGIRQTVTLCAQHHRQLFTPRNWGASTL